MNQTPVTEQDIINIRNEINELHMMNGSIDKYLRDVYTFINKYLDVFPEELKKLKEVLYDVVDEKEENAMEMVDHL